MKRDLILLADAQRTDVKRTALEAFSTTLSVVSLPLPQRTAALTGTAPSH